MEVARLIGPLGIITYSLLLFTVLSGVLKWQMKTHKLIAGITLALATIHGLLVIIYF